MPDFPLLALHSRFESHASSDKGYLPKLKAFSRNRLIGDGNDLALAVAEVAIHTGGTVNSEVLVVGSDGGQRFKNLEDIIWRFQVPSATSR